MDQAKIATDGTLSWNIRAGWRKRPILLPYQIGMAGIAIFIAFAATMFLVVTDPAQPTALSRSLRDAAPPPVGNWNCTLPGRAVGRLRVDGWRYVLTPEAGEPRGGSLAPVGGQAIKNKAAYVRITSGPLKEDFGVGLGHHVDQVEPEILVLNVGPGSGIRCAGV